MANHDVNAPGTSLKVESEGGFPFTLHWSADEMIRPGEVLNLYGRDYHNTDLLATYGFMIKDNPHSRVLVAPHLKRAVLNQFNCTPRETSTIERIADEAKFITRNAKPTALVAAFRFMLCKSNQKACSSTPYRAFANRLHEIQAYELAAKDIANFDKQVAGTLAEDEKVLREDARLGHTQLGHDMRLALRYRVEQRQIVQWQIAWLTSEATRMGSEANKAVEL